MVAAFSVVEQMAELVEELGHARVSQCHTQAVRKWSEEEEKGGLTSSWLRCAEAISGDGGGAGRFAGGRLGDERWKWDVDVASLEKDNLE